MRRRYFHVSFVIILALHSLSIGQTTCANYNKSASPGDVTLPSTAQHTSGLHSWTQIPLGSCTYTSTGNTNCSTECQVYPSGWTTLDPLGWYASSEVGSIRGAEHWISGNFYAGVSYGAGTGTQCTSQEGGAAIACNGTAGNCSFSVSISSNGGVTVAAPGKI